MKPVFPLVSFAGKPLKSGKLLEPYKPTFVKPKDNDPEWLYRDKNAWKSYRRYVVNKWLNNPIVKPVNETLKKINPNWGLEEKPLIIPERGYVTSWNKLTYNQYNKARVFKTLFPKASAELSHIYKFPETDVYKPHQLYPAKY